MDGVISREVCFMPKKEALLILSVGPYSGIPADVFDYSEEVWYSYSHTISCIENVLKENAGLPPLELAIRLEESVPQ